MTAPLDRLLRDSASLVGGPSLDTFLADADPGLLIVTGDPAQRPEAQDVAVVARELSRSMQSLRVGFVSREAEAEAKTRFGITTVPAVLFVKGGMVRATVAGLRDWNAYARASALVFGKPTETPT